MSISKKYQRTYHIPGSPGTTSDDRIAPNILNLKNKQTVWTEKGDGQNNCFSKYGLFARSHALPSQLAWDRVLVEHWNKIKNDLGTLEIFGENMYAIHSIEYSALTSFFYAFAVRDGEHWLSWEEVEFYAAMLDFPTVPVIKKEIGSGDAIEVCKEIIEIVKTPSLLSTPEEPAPKEGVVIRLADGFHEDEFSNSVFKWVRKDHVKTIDKHWTKNWKKATIHY
jgi:hypothetical protein